MTDTPELARIRAALEAGPTPGPWVSSQSDMWTAPSGKFCQWGRYLISAGSKDEQVDDYYRIAAVSNVNDQRENKVNADLIEACNPAAMTAVLAHIDAQAAEIAAYALTVDNLRAQLEARCVPDEMDASAIKYAHKLALDLECVLADYSGKWWDTAMQTISGYRTEMNAIHERESPTWMGEPVIDDKSDCHGPDWTDRDTEYLK